MRRVQTIMFFPNFPTASAVDPELALLPAARRARPVEALDGRGEGLSVPMR